MADPAASSQTAARAATWVFDPAHNIAEFSVRHMMIATVKGRFKKMEGKVVGDLTMRGVTKEVPVDVTFDGQGKDPWGNERSAFSAETRVNRKEFGLNWNTLLETGGVLVGDEVRINVHVEAIKQV